MKSEKMLQITVFFCLCYSHPWVSSPLLLSFYWNPQQFAPDFSSHCSIKHRELSGAEWHGKSISYLKSLIELRTLEWLCLAELCPRGWADRLVTLQASREDQFFAEILKQIKRFFRPYFHLQDTLWAISRHWHRLKNYFFVFAGCLCLSVSLWLLAKLSAYCTALCMYTLLVDAVWTSNPAKREPESLSCWMCFLSLPSLSSLGVKKELLCKGKLGFGRQIFKI